MAEQLSEREKTVLRYVVHDFIETATPIGSRYISRRHEDEIGLSSASIRNVMSDLEDWGFIDHPHTSAGRIPTDLGYRFYVDSLMELEEVSEDHRRQIKDNIDASPDPEMVVKESARLLSRISRQLCIVTSPELSSGIFEKLELVQIATTRIMVIISVRWGLVRTIMLEVSGEIPRSQLDDLARALNERLSGLTLRQIRETFIDRVRDVQNEETGLIRIFVDSVEKLFIPNKADSLYVNGTENIIDQPEFVNPKNFRGVIELISNHEIIVHVLEKSGINPMETKVSVGAELNDVKLKDYSVVCSTYAAGDLGGSVAVLGPKRMPYARMIPLVDYVAKTISKMFSNQYHA